MFKVYEVQCIIDESVINYEPHFLIKWKNLGHEHDTWEPISNLNNIREYLQYWIAEKRLKNTKAKASKSKNYNNIKPYLYSGELLGQRRSSKNQHYSSQILARKKIWEKYIETDQKCIQIEEDCRQRQFFSKNKELMDEILKDKRNKRSMKRQQKKKQTNNIQLSNKITQQPNSHFSVIGQIDLKKITKIIRAFEWKQTKCLEVEMTNGQRFNTIETQLRKHNPTMVIQFFEKADIQF